MRIDLKVRPGRASAAIVIGLVATLGAVVGMASTASAQSCNTPWSNCGWTWGERYGAPPANTYYYSPGYSGYHGRQPSYGYYAPRNAYPQTYYGNGADAAGQLGGLFVR